MGARAGVVCTCGIGGTRAMHRARLLSLRQQRFRVSGYVEALHVCVLLDGEIARVERCMEQTVEFRKSLRWAAA